MPRFVLMFHGGETPEQPSPEVMDRWMAWFGQLGDAVVDMGAPLPARTRQPATRSSRLAAFTMPWFWRRDATA
jgi:hypothetical protein